jgi:hypothetical protein
VSAQHRRRQHSKQTQETRTRGNPCVVVGGFSLIITKGTQRGTLLKDLKIHLFNLCR